MSLRRRLVIHARSISSNAKLGAQTVANCASCHGVHNILPSSDPRSTINRANLIKTCGQCHPGVGEKFVIGKVHVDAPLSADLGSVGVRWIRKFYLSLNVVVNGGMVLHNFIIWRRKALLHRAAQHRIVIRMSGNQRGSSGFVVRPETKKQAGCFSGLEIFPH